MSFPVALQLYSVRDDLSADFEGTLKKVKELGYQGVEFAGLYGHDAEQVKKLLEENGYGSQRVAVEVNYEIIPRSQHNDYILHSGDVVEIVSFVGGG